MNLHEFRQHARAVFAENLPRVLDEEKDLQDICEQIFTPLEDLALTEKIEVCPRSAWVLVMGLCDEYLCQNREELHVPDEYFEHSDPMGTVYLRARLLGHQPEHGAMLLNDPRYDSLSRLGADQQQLLARMPLGKLTA